MRCYGKTFGDDNRYSKGKQYNYIYPMFCNRERNLSVELMQAGIKKEKQKTSIETNLI
jgi:hypothetical protein